jgi:hypothetical protein
VDGSSLPIAAATICPVRDEKRSSGQPKASAFFGGTRRNLAHEHHLLPAGLARRTLVVAP